MVSVTIAEHCIVMQLMFKYVCVECVLQLLQPSEMAGFKEKNIPSSCVLNLKKTASETCEML
jgi:hypothetical protein